MSGLHPSTALGSSSAVGEGKQAHRWQRHKGTRGTVTETGSKETPRESLGPGHVPEPRGSVLHTPGSCHEGPFPVKSS